MANISLSIKYRPLRIGFCVKVGNIDDLATVAELNTLLCGGMYNPIIPVGDDELSDNFLKVFNVDLLYPVSTGSEVREFISKQEHLKSFELQNQFLWSTDQGWAGRDGKVRLRVLDVISGLEKYVAAPHNKIVNVQWKDDDPLANLFSLEFGRFPAGEHPYNLPNTFKSPFFEKPLNVASESVLDAGLLLHPTPIHISTLNTHLWGNYSGWSSDGVYIGNQNDFDDLVNYWNLRATGLDILFVPFKYTGIFKQIAKIHVDRIKEQDDKSKFPGGVSCWYKQSVSQEIINVVVQELELEAILRVRSGLDNISWNGLNIHASKPIISTKTIIADVDTKYGSPRLSFQLPDMPVPQHGGYIDSQHLCLTINPITEFEYEGYTLKQLPYFTDLNEWYSRRIQFSPYKVRIEPDGFSLIIDTHDSVETMSPVKNDVLLKQLFKRAGIEAKDSQAGLLARKLIEQMDGLEGCRVFKIPGVRKLIASMRVDTYIKRGEALRIINDKDPLTKKASFDEHKDLYIQVRDSQELTEEDVFDALILQRLFRAGIGVECPSCRLRPWFAIKDLSDHVICEFCEGEISILLQFKHSAFWTFRKSGLIGKDNNQEGAIPVALTLLQFLRMSHIDEFVHSTALKLDSTADGIDCETDFAILGTAHSFVGRDSPAIAIGEVKSNADEISDKDIANLSKVKEVLDKSGVKTYLVFAKTAQFTDEEIKRFKDLVANGITPILLTNTELEPYEPYDHYRKNNITLPQPYGSSFEDMAQNSLSVYLKDSSDTQTGSGSMTS